MKTLKDLTPEIRAKISEYKAQLEPNTIYEITLQNEYNPFSNTFENVLD